MFPRKQLNPGLLWIESGITHMLKDALFFLFFSSPPPPRMEKHRSKHHYVKKAIKGRKDLVLLSTEVQINSNPSTLCGRRICEAHVMCLSGYINQ